MIMLRKGIAKLRDTGIATAGTGAVTRRYGTALRSDAKLRQRYDSTDTQSEGIAQFGGAGQRQSSEWICNGEGEVELSLAWRRKGEGRQRNGDAQNGWDV